MLTAEENELLCRVEGNAPMGQLMRRHWVPALLTEEVPDKDSDPVPLRLFGEDLVAWRNTDGEIGLMDRYCPHRKASLHFGRNENNSLRCLYHGWKLNVKGEVVEMPSEPPESCAARKVKVRSYPTHEHAGMVWAYMGPPETMPEFQPPPFAPFPDSKLSIIKIKIDCNWAQVLEGAIDSAHSSTLHSSDITPAVGAGTQPQGMTFLRPSTDKAPRIQVQPTDYGFKYAALRRPIVNAATLDYVRMTVYVAPFTVLIPPNSQYNICNVNVPIDDTHTMFHFIGWVPGPDGGVDQDEYRKLMRATIGVDVNKRYEKTRTLANDFLQDRVAMKEGNFTGITGIPYQDMAMWETMGPIADRTGELLGASDQAVVQFRKLMLDAVNRFQSGGPAIGTIQSSPIPQVAIRSYEGMMPKGADWRHLDIADAPAAKVEPEAEKV
ncbi:MAG: Rieske 2Fe-2S domain-containing protein [Pseudomonadota bacterium]